MGPIFVLEDLNILMIGKRTTCWALSTTEQSTKFSNELSSYKIEIKFIHLSKFQINDTMYGSRARLNIYLFTCADSNLLCLECFWSQLQCFLIRTDGYRAIIELRNSNEDQYEMSMAVFVYALNVWNEY